MLVVVGRALELALQRRLEAVVQQLQPELLLVALDQVRGPRPRPEVAEHHQWVHHQRVHHQHTVDLKREDLQHNREKILGEQSYLWPLPRELPGEVQ